MKAASTAARNIETGDGVDEKWTAMTATNFGPACDGSETDNGQPEDVSESNKATLDRKQALLGGEQAIIGALKHKAGRTMH